MAKQSKQSGSSLGPQNQTHSGVFVEPQSNLDAGTFMGVKAHIPVAAYPPTKVLLTVQDCSNMTSLSQKTILRLLARGKLRSISSIRHKRIPATELFRFIRENLS